MDDRLPQEATPMNKDGNFVIGLLWGSTLSIPLWVSLIGWVWSIADMINKI